MSERRPSSPAPRLAREALIAIPAFGLLTYLVYWPAFSEACCTVFVPLRAQLSSDVNLIQWILATVARSLASNPLELFEGGIFYPSPLPVTASEHMVALQVFFAPLFLLSGNPIWSMQWTIFCGATLCGVAMFLLLRHWRVAVPAAVFGGIVYATFPSRYFGVQMPHVYAVQYLPLAILFLDRSLERRRLGDSALFALFAMLQMLTSFYLAYITVCFIAFYSLGKMVGQGRVDARAWVGPVLAGVLACAVVGVTALPYLERASAGGFRDHAEGQLAMMSNSPWKSFVFPPIAVRSWGWKNFGMANYLGLIPLGLALVGCVGVRDPRQRPAILGLLFALLASYLLSLGPPRSGAAAVLGLPYAWAETWLPGFSIMRVPSRFVAGVMLSVAALAGIGASRVMTRLSGVGRQPIWRWAIAGAMIVLTMLEFGVFQYRPRLRRPPFGETLPRVYHELAELEAGPVLEVPGGVLDDAFVVRESEYTYFSIFHRQPLLNGYSGYRPSSYELLMSLARALPDPRAVELLQRLSGLRYIVVHTQALSEVEIGSWREAVGMTRLGRFGPDWLFELSPRDADLKDALLQPGRSTATLSGAPLVRLGDLDRRAAIRLAPGDPLAGVEPTTIGPRQVRHPVRVEVRNDSSAVWPALSVERERLVGWTYRWEEWDGARWLPVGPERRVPLAFDLGPGETTTTTLRVLVPPYRGRFRLLVGLQQEGRWFPDRLEVDRFLFDKPERPKSRMTWRIKGAA